MNREEVLNAVAEMSVLELSELIKDMEEKFGVLSLIHISEPTRPY